MSNAYPERNKNGTKILYYQSKCGCKFKQKDIEKIKVHHQTKYFLKDGTELVRPKPVKEWTMIKPK